MKTEQEKKDVRNAAQRARRASSEAKALEALRSRESKARKTEYGYLRGCGCASCQKVRNP